MTASVLWTAPVLISIAGLHVRMPVARTPSVRPGTMAPSAPAPQDTWVIP